MAAAKGSKAQRAYTSIRERIASQELRPGDRLVLAGLADELEMSVVPVREAIRKLEAEGVVVFETNVGARVARINRERYLNTMQALAIVEGAATALSAPHLGSGRLEAARGFNAELEQLLGAFDGAEYVRLNQAFHEQLYRDCPNEELINHIEEEREKLAMVRDPDATFTAARARDSVQEHEHILQLIESGAPSFEIELAVREHRSATRDAALAHQAHQAEAEAAS